MLLFEPGKYFPSCHASCVLPLPSGRILVAYFAGSYEKCDDVGIWLSVIEADGTVRPPRLLAKLAMLPHWNPVLFPTSDGKVRIVFKVGSVIPRWRSYTMLSADDGETWSAPTAYPENVAGGPVRSKPIRMEGGALLAPNSDESDVWLPRTDISYDDGATFTRLSSIPINIKQPDRANFVAGKGAIQPTLWQDESGLHALLRTTGGYILRSDSADGARTWSEAVPTHLPSNNSGIDILRTRVGLFLALNPVGNETHGFAARTPLCLYAGKTCETLAPFRVIEDAAADPDTGKPAEFSYPSLAKGKDEILLTYTWNRRSIGFVRIPFANL